MSKIKIKDLDCIMKEKTLYNPTATEDTSIINGDSTNLLVLEDPRHDWGFKLYKDMFNARWGIEDVSMIDDPSTYNMLTDYEAEAYDGTIGFLAFLDSLQVNNTGHIAEYITAPEVTICFAEQTASEALHSVTYQHIFESLKLSREHILKIYYKWKDDPILYNRNEYIANIYQDFLDNKTLRNYLRAMIADLLLEGLYFYNGFQYFYNLASRGLLTGTAGNIKLINKDESMHVALYQNVLGDIIDMCDYEVKDIIYSMLIDMTEIAIEQEVEWAISKYGDGKILGINNKSIVDYTRHLAYKNMITVLPKEDERRKSYSKVKNPYAHLDKLVDLNGDGTNKAGFFERGTTDYMNVTVFSNFNEF
jgi:ribonucleoside-diphosphate reductase beta chain